jgi:flagellar biosynthesis anti-sigma factor FlgM
MKISDSKALGPVAAAPQQQQRPAASPGPTDTVSAADAERVARAVSVAQQAASPARAERIAQLAAEVRSGTYRPDPNQIASEILDEAQVDARLEALLQR